MSRKELSSKSTENPGLSMNPEPTLWSSTFFQENTGESDKDAAVNQIARNGKCHPHYQESQRPENQPSGTRSDDSSDDNEENSAEPGKKEKGTAPLELMAEFLRAVMDQDYNLAKKLCQMILIYEPENPEAKQFFPLIEEKLLMDSAQGLGDEDYEESDEDSDDSEEESSDESDNDESEDTSDYSKEEM
ncbi:glutamate-rich protein 2 isoform X2 [Tachyglossus aculeatus]|nr:glutamate-rich protein 2 isoform X2 [Tachyglossus aculeatus]XP_038607532.1 glutamate-rich protein 2 isoform X2 [Tachyglossus aculeatus]XP_038607533.1 glutamate-rich protein 2 isoform X2 [Tachyglossus aculeatus]XP_038607535.1 glutamate-rich protein 2 isoform X2 [Tachyglossus aculeatus]XP_038607536.1 glutamate-rich protein 2 isoform X2 [Tachyglossus aculeatus]XP_038607537.1 glutamate-rich protein 2 isoform X2 [Tachyglossus aculeatus]